METIKLMEMNRINETCEKWDDYQKSPVIVGLLDYDLVLLRSFHDLSRGNLRERSDDSVGGSSPGTNECGVFLDGIWNENAQNDGVLGLCADLIQRGG